MKQNLKIVSPGGKQKVLYDEVNRIYQKNKKITPDQIIELARDENHPLHDYFEWDDAIAGNKYRLIQAREIIKNIMLVIKNEETGERFKVRAFLNVNEAEDGELCVNGNQLTENYYINQSQVRDSEDLRKYQLRKARAELLAFKEKYRLLSDELEDVFKAIDEL